MSNSLVRISLELVSNNEPHRMRKKTQNAIDVPHGGSVSAVINHEKDSCKG